MIKGFPFLMKDLAYFQLSASNQLNEWGQNDHSFILLLPMSEKKTRFCKMLEFSQLFSKCRLQHGSTSQ